MAKPIQSKLAKARELAIKACEVAQAATVEGATRADAIAASRAATDTSRAVESLVRAVEAELQQGDDPLAERLENLVDFDE